jgi:hypothetical protein
VRALDSRATNIIAVFDPATEEQIGEIPDGGRQAVDLAVALSREAFVTGVWRSMPPGQRAKIMWKVGDLVEERIEDLFEIEARNNGMSRMADAELPEQSEMYVDLPLQRITRTNGESIAFDLAEDRKQALLNGLDELAETLLLGSRITHWEQTTKRICPEIPRDIPLSSTTKKGRS